MLKKISYFIFLLGVFSLIRTILLLSNAYFPDFDVLYTASKSLLQNNNPYTSYHFTQVSYPPVTLFLIMPFLAFPFSVASEIWLYASAISLLLTIRVLYYTQRVSFFLLSLIFFAAVISFPIKFTLGMGQVNIFLLLFLSIFIYSIKNNKDFAASFYFFLAVVTKLFPMLLLLPIALSNRKRILFFLILLFVITLLTSLLSLENTIYYLRNVLYPLLVQPAGDVYYNQSITGFFERIHMQGAVAFLLRVSILLISILIMVKNKNDILMNTSLMLTTILMINNFTWQHHLVLLLIPYYIILSRRQPKRIISLVIFSYFLVAYNIKNPILFEELRGGSFVFSHGFFGIFLIWLTCIFSQKKVLYEKNNILL